MKTLAYLVKPILVLLLLFIYSCDTDEINNSIDTDAREILSKDQIENASMDQKIDYKNHHLKILGDWFANNHEKTVDLFYESETEKEGTDEYFLEELVQKFSDRESKVDLTSSLNAFTELHGVNWKPSIFLIGNSKIKTPKTYLAIESNTPNGEFFKGYAIFDNQLLPLRSTLNQELVGDNNLYVIELDREPTRITNQADNKSNHKLVIEKMKIKDLKSVWPGKSDVAFQGFKLSNPINATYGCGEYISGSANCDDPSGKRIVKLKRKYKNKTRTYNFLVKNDNNPNDFIYYIIFEYDSFPAPHKIAQHYVGNNGSIAYLNYRSWNSKYDNRVLTQQQANNFRKSNSDIEYNLKLK